MEAFNALYDEPSLRLVLVRHEQSAAYMADGYARTTGKPGVAMVVPGPGALNATAALGTAFASSSPVMLISGQIESYNLGANRGALHEIGEQLDVFKHLTKWCERSIENSEIPTMVHRAFQQLTTGRPRPVEIEIPWDILPGQSEIELLEREVHPKVRPEP
jgi:acetolactate synthase-1/2/3 large subunit